MIRRILIGACSVLAVVLLAVAASSGGSPSSDDRVAALSEQIRCPVCDGLAVADSPSSTARAIAGDIRRRVAAGETDETIRAAYVARYGDWILLEPPSRGMGALVWFAPVAFVATAGCGAAWALYRRGRRTTTGPTPDDVRLVEEARAGLVNGTRQRRGAPGVHVRLEDERDLLLRELDDIDSQHRSGEIGDDQHRSLSAEITHRAADALRGVDRSRPVRYLGRRRPVRRIVVIVGCGAVALAAGGLLVGQVAPRVPPAPPTEMVNGMTARVARLAEAVADRPDDVETRLALARLLMQAQDLVAALEQFDAVVERDPEHVEALAYGGWIAELTAAGGAGERLDAAVTADPGYPDAHALRGLYLMRRERHTEAIAEFDAYLQLAPAGPLAPQVEQVRARLAESS